MELSFGRLPALSATMGLDTFGGITPEADKGMFGGLSLSKTPTERYSIEELKGIEFHQGIETR